MVRFELVDDERSKYWKVILDNQNIIGIISEYGFRFSVEQDNSLTVKSDDWNLIGQKILEVEKFGMLICYQCDGSPMFPNYVKFLGVDVICPENIHSCNRGQ